MNQNTDFRLHPHILSYENRMWPYDWKENYDVYCIYILFLDILLEEEKIIRMWESVPGTKVLSVFAKEDDSGDFEVNFTYKLKEPIKFIDLGNFNFGSLTKKRKKK